PRDEEDVLHRRPAASPAVGEGHPPRREASMTIRSDVGAVAPGSSALSMTAVSARSAALTPLLRALGEVYYSPPLVFALLCVELVSQLALLVPFFAPARVVVRTASFVGSVAYLFVLQRAGGERHPSWPMAILSLVVVAASIVHPDTSNAWAGFASVLLH